MSLTKRIIPCLDINNGRVVKGTQFINLKDAGNPIELAKFYDKEGADELLFLDITASSNKRNILIDLVEKTGDQVFIPFTVGGGLRTIKDIREILRAGADKVSLNTAAVKKPRFIKEAAKIFGSQCIVVSIDAKRVIINSSNKKIKKEIKTEQDISFWWEVYINGGRTPTKMDAIKWAEKVEKLGAGEILITSMDKDGVKKGYDIELTRTLSDRLNIPIIASGGAGNPTHIVDVFKKGKADAALATSIFHYKEYSIKLIKDFCIKNGIPMRVN